MYRVRKLIKDLVPCQIGGLLKRALGDQEALWDAWTVGTLRKAKENWWTMRTFRSVWRGKRFAKNIAYDRLDTKKGDVELYKWDGRMCRLLEWSGTLMEMCWRAHKVWWKVNFEELMSEERIEEGDFVK